MKGIYAYIKTRIVVLCDEINTINRNDIWIFYWTPICKMVVFSLKTKDKITTIDYLLTDNVCMTLKHTEV